MPIIGIIIIILLWAILEKMPNIFSWLPIGGESLNFEISLGLEQHPSGSFSFLAKAKDKLEIEKKFELIEKFIEASPKISPTKESLPEPINIARSNETSSSIMTETLAKIYLEQKKYAKAIQAYEILILKYPEKSSFFADRINEIKNLQQNNN